MTGNEADAYAHRKPREPRDLFQLIGRAVDEGVEKAGLGSVSVSSWVDPLLRLPREVEERRLIDTVGRLIAVALAGSPERRVAVRAEPSGDDVRISAAAGPERVWTVTVNAPPTRRKVLVIDDDPMARIELSDALRAAGFGCETATGSEVALHALFAGGPWAAVLIELYLESGDALELAGVSEAPVFAMSGGDRNVSGWALRQAGFQGLFSKPVSMAKLKAAIAA